MHGGERVVRDYGAAFLNGGREVLKRRAQRLGAFDGLEFSASSADPREREQAIDQALHSRRAIDDVGHILAGSLVELPFVMAASEVPRSRSPPAEVP